MNSGQNNVPYLNVVHDHAMFGSMWVVEQEVEETDKGENPLKVYHTWQKGPVLIVILFYPIF